MYFQSTPTGNAILPAVLPAILPVLSSAGLSCCYGQAPPVTFPHWGKARTVARLQQDWEHAGFRRHLEGVGWVRVSPTSKLVSVSCDSIPSLLPATAPSHGCSQIQNYYPLSYGQLHFVRNSLGWRAEVPSGHLTMTRFLGMFSILHLIARYCLEKFGYRHQKNKTLWNK